MYSLCFNEHYDIIFRQSFALMLNMKIYNFIMFVLVAYDQKPYESFCWGVLFQNIWLIAVDRNCGMPLSELKVNRGEEKLKKSENCFQMHWLGSSPFLTVSVPQHSSLSPTTPSASFSLSVASMLWLFQYQGQSLEYTCFLHILATCKSTVCAPYVAQWPHHAPHIPVTIRRRWGV